MFDIPLPNCNLLAIEKRLYAISPKLKPLALDQRTGNHLRVRAIDVIQDYSRLGTKLTRKEALLIARRLNETIYGKAGNK